MAEETDDIEEKLDPTIRYLQKLGPEHLDLIFEGSKWVFAADWQRALVVSISLLVGILLRACNVLEPPGLYGRHGRGGGSTSACGLSLFVQDRATSLFFLPRAYHS
jgi:hypothetical protein